MMTEDRCTFCGEDDPTKLTAVVIPTIYDGVIVWRCLSCDKHSPVEFPQSARMSARSREVASRMNGDG